MISANTKGLLAFHAVGQIPWNKPSQYRKKRKKTGGNPVSGFNQKLEPEHVSWKNIFPGYLSGRDSVPWEQNKLGGQVWPQVRQSTRSDCCESLGLWRLSRTHRTSLKQKTHTPPWVYCIQRSFVPKVRCSGFCLFESTCSEIDFLNSWPWKQ